MTAEPIETDAGLERAVQEAFACAQSSLGEGRVATYIPELGRADPSKLAVNLHTVDGRVSGAGDVDEPFTLQSISKVFTLAYALRSGGDGFLRQMSMEPSGDAFHSIVRLEQEQGRPRNPYINTGAILVSEQLPGRNPEEKIDGFLDFLKELARSDRIEIDDNAYRSESETGNRNRALAHFMKHHGTIENPTVAVETYFRQCSIRATALLLGRMSLFLANKGVDPVTGRRILDEKSNGMIVALMATCGLYDEIGRFAVRVGLPGKSGVSGGIMAVAPQRMTIAVFSPKLDPKGNSVAGLAALTALSEKLRLSLFE